MSRTIKDMVSGVRERRRGAILRRERTRKFARTKHTAPANWTRHRRCARRVSP